MQSLFHQMRVSFEEKKYIFLKNFVHFAKIRKINSTFVA